MSDSSESESGALAPRRPVSPRKLKRQRLPARGSDSGALARDLGVPPSGVGSSKGPGTRPVQTELSKTRARAASWGSGRASGFSVPCERAGLRGGG